MLQLLTKGELCLITISTNIRGPILPSGSITEYLLGAVHKTKNNGIQTPGFKEIGSYL